MDDNRLRENSDVGSSSVQVVDSPSRGESDDVNNHFIEEDPREVGDVAVVSFNAEEQNGDLNIGQNQDQESQVVPDGSTVVSSERRFVSENLHETMEAVTDRTVLLEVQMVPTANEEQIVTNAEMIVLSESEYERTVDATLPQETRESPIATVATSNEVPVLEAVDDGQLSVVTEPTAVVPVMVKSEESVESIQEPTVTDPNFQTVENEVVTSYLVQDQSGNVEIVQSDDHTYDLCVTMPDDPNGSTVPYTVDDRDVQGIPMEVSDWSSIGEQSLVAITEDGTTIPLTVIRQEPGGELVYQAEGNNIQLSNEILQQLANSHFIDGTEMDANVSDGQETVEVIEMLQSEDGTMILDSADGVPSSSSQQQIIYRDTMMAESEQTILPDVIQDITNVIHLPENAFLSGQPFEVQFIDVDKDVPVVETLPSRSLLKQQLRAPPRSRPSASNQAPPMRPKSIRARSKSPNAPQVAKVNMPLQNEVKSREVTTSGDDDDGESVIQLSNTTPSVISPENMQELIQILQTLPLTARGQTIQIILQSSPATMTTTTADTQVKSEKEVGTQPGCSRPQSPAKPIVRIGDDNMVPFIKMVPSRSRNKTTMDIAIQVNPEFIDDATTTAPIDEVTVDQPSSSVVDETIVSIVDVENKDADIVKSVPAISDDDRSKAIVEAILESSRKKRPYRKKNSNKIVTLEEQWVTDPKPGVSYYAVVDYLSEHDQDGFSSASEMKRPNAPSSDFMEDHLELQNIEVDYNKTRSILESTIDSSVVVSPFRRGRQHRASCMLRPANYSSIDLPSSIDQSSVTLTERTFEEAQLEEENLSVGPMPEVIQRRKRKGGRVKAKKTFDGFDHKCGYCSFDSADKILVVEHCIREHPDEPVKTLSLLPQTVGRTCPYCLQSFEHSEFFSHMRFAHNEVHPYKCGYCDFMGRDRNQIRHHIQKKHRLPIKVINLLELTKKQSSNESSGRKRIMALSDGEDTVYEYLTDEEELEDDDSDNTTTRRGLICPECKKTFKTLKYLKTHIKIHQAHRYQCGYCDFISIMLHQVLRHCQKKHADVDPKVLTKELEPEKNPVVSRDIDDIVKKVFSLNTRLPRDPDTTKWMRKWFCPHCDYTCQFGASYRRHLRMHANILPFKCNYCSFKGREKYYVRRHITRMHSDLPVIVVENTPENCARDTSSDEDFQEKGLRRKRRRRTKDQLHTVVPVEEIDPDEFQEQYQMQPIREKMGFGKFANEDSQNVPPAVRAARYEEEKRRTRTAFVSRLNSEQWTGEKISDFIQEKDGDEIVCKVCGHKMLAKAFDKHARKHFKVKPFKCGYCNHISVEKTKIRVHSSMKHPNLPCKIEECHLASLAPKDFMDLIGGESGTENQTGTGNDPQFLCPLCQSQVEYDEKILSEHFYSHFEYFPYQCSECDHQNVSEQKVIEHATSHHSTFAIYETGQTKPEGLEETIQQFLKEGQELVQRKLLELMDQGTARSSADDENEETNDKVESSPIHLFLCPICDHQMKLRAVTVRRHLYSHYGYKPFKCGHCSFLGVSRAKIKRHSMTHDGFQSKVEITDELMPEDLAKMLREIHGQMKQLASTDFVRDKKSNEKSSDMISGEGKIWNEMLSKGKCPWCDTSLGSSFIKLRDHLLGHFNSKPHRCGHCDEEFTRRHEVNKHIIKNHPNQELKVIEPDEDTVRKGLRIYLNDKKRSKAVEEVTKPAKDVEPEPKEKKETSSLKQTENVPKEDMKNDGNDKNGTELPENKKVESTTNVYDFDDDADIVTVEGVLLTRTFRSETEAASDEDDDRESDVESEDEEEIANEEDFFVGDVSSNFVLDIMNILKKSSFTRTSAGTSKRGLQVQCETRTSTPDSDSNASKNKKLTCDQCDQQFDKHRGLQAHITKVHSRPREDGGGQVFVCDYCEFSGNDENIAKEHMEENHSDKPNFIKKGETGPRRGVRRRGGARKRPPAKRVRNDTAQERKEIGDEEGEEEEEDEEETLENITKMVQSSASTSEEVVVEEQSVVVKEPSTVRRYELRGKGKSEKQAQSSETLPKEQNYAENPVTEESIIETTVNEEQLHSLTPLVPTTIKKEDEICMETLENLEECDDNLPKILEILQLRPAIDDIESNTSEI